MICSLAVALLTAAPPTTGLLATVNKGEETVSLVSLATGETLAKLKTGPSPQEVVFTPDGKLAIISCMGGGPSGPGRILNVVDVPGRKAAREIDLKDQGAPHGLAVLDQDRVLMTSHQTDSLVVVNHKTGALEKIIPTEGKGSHLALLSPDKSRAYAVNVLTADVSVVDLKEGKIVKRIPCGPRAEGIALSPDGKILSVGNVAANTVTVIDAQKLEVVKTLEGLPGPIRTFFSSDGSKLLVSCAGSGEIAAYSTKDYSLIKKISLAEGGRFTLKGGSHPIPMNFDRHGDGRHVFVAVINADAVAVVNTESLSVVGSFSTGNLPDGIAWWGEKQG